MTKDDIFLKEKTNYMIVLRRNGEIADVWKLKDAVVEHFPAASGWRVITNQNAAFFITGDVEIWHIEDEDSDLWNMYHKYHAHNAEKSYREMFTLKPPPPPPPPKKRWFKWPYSVKWNW